MPCSFCNLGHEKNAFRLIEERKFSFVTLSNPRKVKGHLLVIPKRHVEKPTELTLEERRELFDVIIAYQGKILSTLASGCDIRQHCRPFLKESRYKVDHVHFHLVPREFEDEMYQKSMIFEKELFKDLTAEEAKEVKRVLGEG